MPKTQIQQNPSLAQEVWDVLKGWGREESSALNKFKGKKNKTWTHISNDLNVDETPCGYLEEG